MSLAKESIRFYHGKSMQGTFCPGDSLTVRPISLNKVRRGDIIIYRQMDKQDVAEEIIHRVVDLVPAGLVTCGDSNPFNDAGQVTAENLVGVVTCLERNNRVKKVHGGRRGLWLARFWGGARWIDRRLRRLFWKPYDKIRNCALIRQILYRWFSPYLKVAHLNSPEGPLVKTIFRGRTVALWKPQQGQFECRKPYDLFVPRPDGSK
ncbi:MAG: signal peptidase I [Anaerolineales bacterium]